MKAKCIDATLTDLLLTGKVYDILGDDGEFYTILSEYGEEVGMWKERFELMGEGYFSIDVNEFGTSITTPKKFSIKQSNKIIEILGE